LKKVYRALGRNIARGPGYWEMDLGLEKRTPITEHVGVSFRGLRAKFS